MTGQKSPKRSAGAILDRLAAEEATAVLRHLLEKHPELCPEAREYRHRPPIIPIGRRHRGRGFWRPHGR
jgi:hypothetical protein